MASVDLEELRWAVETLRWVRDRKAEIKDVEDKARDAVEQALGDADAGALDGHEVITWKHHKRTALDQRVLKSAFPEVYAECVRTSEVRRFLIDPES
jgi:predicted phage-related endonuclease